MSGEWGEGLGGKMSVNAVCKYSDEIVVKRDPTSPTHSENKYSLSVWVRWCRVGVRGLGGKMIQCSKYCGEMSTSSE